jgi:hypothetical protein
MWVECLPFSRKCRPRTREGTCAGMARELSCAELIPRPGNDIQLAHQGLRGSTMHVIVTPKRSPT